MVIFNKSKHTNITTFQLKENTVFHKPFFPPLSHCSLMSTVVFDFKYHRLVLIVWSLFKWTLIIWTLLHLAFIHHIVCEIHPYSAPRHCLFVPLCDYTTVYLFFHSIVTVGIWVIFRLGILWVVLLWTFLNLSFNKHAITLQWVHS